jgi:hypothetical protein
LGHVGDPVGVAVDQRSAACVEEVVRVAGGQAGVLPPEGHVFDVAARRVVERHRGAGVGVGGR